MKQNELRKNKKPQLKKNKAKRKESVDKLI